MADETTQVAEQTPAERVMGLEGEQRQDWLKTGKLPEPEVKTEAESSTATPEKEAAVETQHIEKQEPVTRKPSKSERRILELLNDKKRLEAELASRTESKADDAAVKEVTTEKKTAKEASAKPVLANYQTYEDWVEAVSDWKADQRVTAALEADRSARETAAKQAEVETKNKTIEKQWMDKVNKSKQRHSDYEDIAFSKERTVDIKPGTVLDGWILDSDHGAELLYHLASNPEEITRINKLPSPFQQSRELTKMETSLFEKAPAKVATITRAPRPPSEVGGTGTVSDDPVDAALARGNFRSYADEMNRRELKQSRKG